MRLLLLVLLAACAATQTPADVLGRGTYCQVLSRDQSKQLCSDSEDRQYLCTLQTGGSWICEPVIWIE